MKPIFLLSAAMMAAAAPSAFAADDGAVMKRLDQMQKMIEAQQKQIELQKKEINGLNRALGRKSIAAPEPVAAPVPAAPVAPPPVVETWLQQQDQKIDDVVAKFAAEQDARRLAVQEAPLAERQQWPAPDRFRRRPLLQRALRLTAQYDLGYYMQGARARTLPLGSRLFQRRQFPPCPDRPSGQIVRRLVLFRQYRLRLGRPVMITAHKIGI